MIVRTDNYSGQYRKKHVKLRYLPRMNTEKLNKKGVYESGLQNSDGLSKRRGWEDNLVCYLSRDPGGVWLQGPGNRPR